MTTISGLNIIERAVEVGATLTQYWFRGQPRCYPTLLPRAHRDETSIRAEAHRLKEFRRQAPALAEELPAAGDDLGWLVLMQHHRLPTRLLDWSESLLVALYFAVGSDFEEDGELWCLMPDGLLPLLWKELKEYEGRRYLKFGELPPDWLQRMAEDAFSGNQRQQSTLWFRPPMRFPRMVAQLSAFTIHPSPLVKLAGEDAITGLEAEEEIDADRLVRYPIQAGVKRGLLRDLAALGITARTLFPDLDHLAESVSEVAEFRNEEVEEVFQRNRVPEPFEDLGLEPKPPSWPESQETG